MHIVALILIVILIPVWLGLQRAYRDQTGVDMPSRQAAKRLRRRARQKGTSMAYEHDAWVNRKRKSKGFPPL